MEPNCDKWEFKSAQRVNISERTMLELLQSESEEGEAETATIKLQIVRGGALTRFPPARQTLGTLAR